MAAKQAAENFIDKVLPPKGETVQIFTEASASAALAYTAAMHAGSDLRLPIAAGGVAATVSTFRHPLVQ